MDDKISQLPDDLLLKVLTFLPTKVAVSTSILSKRWEFLWMWLPKLEYDDSEYSPGERYKLYSFIDLSLPLHKAPVIERLRLNFDVYGRSYRAYSIEKLVLIAVTRCVRELSVTLVSMPYKFARLPSNLFTCKSLVILELTGPIFVNVPRMVYLPSLKFLILGCMVYSNEKSLHQLLSHCPVLEDLVLERNDEDNNSPFTLSVIVPSLQRLTLKISRGYHFEGLVINTPSLMYFKILDYLEEYARDDNSNYSYYFEDTPKLEEADIESTYPDINKFVRSIRSVKRLSLCIRVNADEEALYHEGIVFDQLQHLKLCSCGPNWSKLLVRLLKDSPLLRDLEIYLNEDHTSSRVDAPVSWQNQLDCVPTCLLASLETFKWTVVYVDHKKR
ncbi:unnamed protein product [Brassica rapa]|uniref:F-box domain-containing protein n=1 Tax=Brassica campestris TaxID=3711 RepID=A0A8D9M3W6_BRACM|nr:unnamed protein product [Brassica rapa]